MFYLKPLEWSFLKGSGLIQLKWLFTVGSIRKPLRTVSEMRVFPGEEPLPHKEESAPEVPEIEWPKNSSQTLTDSEGQFSTDWEAEFQDPGNNGRHTAGIQVEPL